MKTSHSIPIVCLKMAYMECGSFLTERIQKRGEKKTDHRFMRAVAEWYESAESRPDDPRVRYDYAEFTREIDSQYQALIGFGFAFQFTDSDPYRTSEELFAACDRREVRVFSGACDHPVMTPDQNMRFRAVHDAFGHAMMRHSFGKIGEFNAYLEHRRMFFSIGARNALAVETLCQNAHFNYGPNSSIPRSQRPFSPQKAVRVPDWIIHLHMEH